MSAFGGKADVNQRLLNRPLIAISGHSRQGQQAAENTLALFDHLGGAKEDRWQNREAKRAHDYARLKGCCPNRDTRAFKLGHLPPSAPNEIGQDVVVNPNLRNMLLRRRLIVCDEQIECVA